MNRIMMLTIGLIGMIAIIGCSSKPVDPDAPTKIEIVQSFIETENLEPIKRIRTNNIGGWDLIDTKYILANNYRKQFVIIELRNRCSGLGRYYDTVGLNRTSTTSLTTSDSVFVPDFPQMRCPIKTFYSITREQRDALLESIEKK